VRNISVLGSTGSIGRATLDIVSCFPERFKVIGLAARKNIDLLESQIKTHKPEIVAVFDEDAGRKLRQKNLPAQIVTGQKGLEKVATVEQADMIVSAVMGSDALIPTYSAISAGKDIALASKESLVMAGAIIMAEAAKRGVKIIPVDSEHNAIFQCLNGRKQHEVQKIILTASGGAFLKKNITELKSVTPEEALKHPNWSMGKKITIDSATLMNKGLEVIEAHWLFGLPAEKIKVVLHPQSIVHSMVEFIDGSVIAQMSVPDMRGPISYALSFPKRLGNVLPSLDLTKVKELTFEDLDWNKYKSLSLTYSALKTGGTMPSVLNAANEIAVEAFLNKRILFTDIPELVLKTMSQHSVSDGKTIEDVIRASEWAKGKTEELIKK
jgi:1-deoxy-D-xylulose-5-phosphate reductoisomerase